MAGDYYFRRKAYDSAILYFKDVLTKYAAAPKAYDAALRLVESYRKINYREDASELCTQLRQRYPNERRVRSTCQGIPDVQLKADSTAAPPKPPER